MTSRRVLIDHRPCGGSGCKGCRNRGTALVAVMRAAVGPMPSDPGVFGVAREECPCYEGFRINEGVVQCTHADHPSDGEWCDVESCPMVNHAAAPAAQSSTKESGHE